MSNRRFERVYQRRRTLSARGVGASLGALVASGPVGWVIGAIAVVVCVVMLTFKLDDIVDRPDRCSGQC